MTDQERKAMEMALEALETFKLAQNPIVPQSIYVLRQALAQPEQEPVMEVQHFGEKQVFVLLKPLSDGAKLYTAPPSKPWVSLTDEEISSLWSWSMTTDAEQTATTQQHAFARAIEANLKEKNT